jgi:von Willebrand factor type A domain/Aerotolerance regulator N-terminal
MTFLHPALLYLLPLAAIPLVLHLLTLHRLKTVELSTFRFLFDSYVQQRRRMQFLEALLAILRFLFIVMLIFLFTRPVMSSWGALFGGAGTGGREVVLVIDCSASMTARTDGLAALDRAKEAALKVVDRLGSNDRLTLIRLGAQPEEIFSRFPTDRKDIKERIENLQPTSSRGSVLSLLQYLFGSEAGKRGNPAVYLFTDGQATGWRELQKKKEELVPVDTPFWVVNVGTRDTPTNLAVIGDAPRHNRALVGLPFVLQPRVVNFSKTETVEATLSVVINEKELTQTKITLKPGETVTRSIVYTPRDPGQEPLQRCRFEIKPSKPDHFDVDNSFLFTLNVVPRVKMLVVNGNESPDPLESDAAYLMTALTTSPDSLSGRDPSLTGGAPLEASKEFQRSLDVRMVAEAGVTAAALKEVSVVALANCGGLAKSQFELLHDFVRRGGGLLIFPGDKVKLGDAAKMEVGYNTDFFLVPGPLGERLTGVHLEGPVGDINNAETFEPFLVRDFSHPVMSVFENPDPAQKHFKTVQVYRRFHLKMPAPPKTDGKEKPTARPRDANAWPLAWFNEGGPALVESRLGEGVVILSAFPMHPRWTNLPLKPDFVPLMLRLASHVEHRSEVDVPAVVTADSTVEIAVSSDWGKIEGTLRDPSRAVTDLRSFERTGTRQAMTFSGTGKRGYYTVDLRADSLDTPKKATVGFAVNLAPEESDFTVIGKKAMEEALSRGKVEIIDASAETQELKGPIGQGDEVWRFLIGALFVLIACEFLLATLPGGRRDGEDNRTVGQRIMSLSPHSWVARMTGGRK